jgi:hypothetical protein
VELPSHASQPATGGRATTLRATTQLHRTDAKTEERAITLEVLDGPMDGTLLCGALDRVRIGRAAGNDLELHSDRSVSGEHALLSRTDEPGRWRLEDPRSTNGTWVDGTNVRLAGMQMLSLDACFMVGHTVVRCSAGRREETFAPDARRLQEEVRRLASLTTVEAAQAYGAAVGLATAEKRPFITDRHLFLGLVATHAELGAWAKRKAPASGRPFAEVLRQDEYWTGPLAWIDQRVRSSAADVLMLFEEDPVYTPRLLRLLLAAEAEARAAGAERIRLLDLLRAFLAGPANRPRELLAREGIDPASLLAQLGSSLLDATVARERSRPAGAAPAVAAPPAPASCGDPALDARAQDAARRLYGVAALYHLASAEDRYLAIQQLLVEEISHLPAESRPTLLAQLERLFPLIPDAAPGAGAAPPRERTDREREGEREREPPAPARIPWEAILGGADRLEAVGPEDRPAVEFLADILAFAHALERFITSVVQNLRSSGVGTETFQLPGHKVSIKRLVRDLAAGKPPRRGELQDYLRDLDRWLVASIAAYHEGPELWFKDFWRKVSPATIEARPAEDVKGRLVPALEYWNRYKERVRAVSPDLVGDEILHIVKRQADEKFHQLGERRKP